MGVRFSDCLWCMGSNAVADEPVTHDRRSTDIAWAIAETKISGIEKRLARIEMIVWGVAVACTAVLFKTLTSGLKVEM